MKNTLSLRSVRLPLAISAFIFSVAFVAKADLPYGSEALSEFGSFGQGNAGINVANTLNIQPNACVPTAIADGLIFLENNQVADGHTDPFNVSQNNINVVNQLATLMGTENNNFTKVTNSAGKAFYYKNQYNGTAPGTQINAPGGPYYVVKTYYNVGGTALANMKPNLNTYLDTVNPSTLPTIYTSATANVSSAYSLAQALNLNDAVQLTLTWGTNNATTGKFVATGGAHEVDLQSIDFTNATSGIIGLVDPWGATQAGGLPSGTANYISAGVTLTNGGLYISGVFGDGDDVFGNYIGGGETGAGGQNAGAMITYELVESLPDGASTILLLSGSVLALQTIRRRFPVTR